MGVHKVSAFHPFIFQKSGKSTIIRNLAVPRHFVAYLVFISSIRVDPGPRNRGPTSLLALKIRTPVANTGKLRSIGQVPVLSMQKKKNNKQLKRKYQFADSPPYVLDTELYYQINITCI
jgi:hypothetical protein